MKHIEINIQNISTNWDKKSNINVRIEGVVSIDNKSSIKFSLQDEHLTSVSLNEEGESVEIEKTVKILIKSHLFAYVAGIKQKKIINVRMLDISDTTANCDLED